MKKLSLAFAVFTFTLFSVNTFAQQAQTSVTTKPAVVAVPKSAKPTEGYNVDSHMSRDKRAETRILRIEQRVGGNLATDQKAKLKALFLAEFDQLEQAKATLSPENKNPFGAIRKNTDEQIRSLLTREQLEKYSTPIAGKKSAVKNTQAAKVTK